MSDQLSDPAHGGRSVAMNEDHGSSSAHTGNPRVSDSLEALVAEDIARLRREFGVPRPAAPASDAPARRVVTWLTGDAQ